MEKTEYKKMYGLEKNHWWFRGKRSIVFGFIKRYYKKNKKLKILDVGCGTGITLKNMEPYGKVYGIDISKDAIEFCKKRGLKNLKLASVEKIPFKDNTFDIATCFDVLYHKGIKDDLKAIKDIKRVIKSGGRLIITDSAMMCLWSPHDIVVHARTRYSSKDMKLKLKKVGLKIEKLSYFNTFLFPIIFMVRKYHNLIKSKPKIDIKKIGIILNTVLYSILKTEAFLLKFINFPFSVSILCIARKK